MAYHPLLKRCPFCGGDAVWRSCKGGQAQSFDEQYKATCGVGYCAETPYFGRRIEAADWWNRRAPKPQTPRDPEGEAAYLRKFS